MVFRSRFTSLHLYRPLRRVHQEALDTLTLGFQITELRRLAACNTPLGVSSEVPGEGRYGTELRWTKPGRVW